MNPYEILEIAPGASPDEIKQAYHRLAKQWHPDRFSGAEKAAAESRFRQLAEAFGMLKDAVRRGEPAAVAPEPEAASAPRPVVESVAAPVVAAPKVLGVEDWLRQGEDALLKGDVERALGLAHYVLRLDASKAEHHLLLARALEASDGDVRAQVKALEAALMLAPQNVDIMVRLAELFEQVGMAARATGLRDRARQIKPDHPAFKSEARTRTQPIKVEAPSMGEQFQTLMNQLKGALGRLTGRK